MFEIEFTQQALADIDKHKKAGNKALLNKLNTLLEELYQHPFTGTGKPEPLKHNLTGYWSRRINKEHRLVYQVTDNLIYINSLYGHY
jgi:toxin YoeB